MPDQPDQSPPAASAAHREAKPHAAEGPRDGGHGAGGSSTSDRSHTPVDGGLAGVQPAGGGRPAATGALPPYGASVAEPSGPPTHGHAVGHPVAGVGAPHGAAGSSVVPPPPLAPTGPGTPSAYPYGAAPYGVPGSGQNPYGAGGPGYPGYPAGPLPPGSAYPPQAPYGAGWGHGVRWPNNAQGTAALVLGIAGLVLCFSIVPGVVLGILAIVFGALGRGKAQRGEANNGGAALAGLILGVIACTASVAMIFVYATLSTDDSKEDETGGPYGSAVVRTLPVRAEEPLSGL